MNSVTIKLYRMTEYTDPEGCKHIVFNYLVEDKNAILLEEGT